MVDYKVKNRKLNVCHIFLPYARVCVGRYGIHVQPTLRCGFFIAMKSGGIGRSWYF